MGRQIAVLGMEEGVDGCGVHLCGVLPIQLRSEYVVGSKVEVEKVKRFKRRVGYFHYPWHPFSYKPIWRPSGFERLVYSLPTLEQRDRILKCIMEAIKSQK